MCGQEVTHVEEADELLQLVSQVPTTQGVKAASTAFDQYRSIVSHAPPFPMLCKPILACCSSVWASAACQLCSHALCKQ